MGKSKEEIAKYIIESAAGKFLANDRNFFEIYNALKNHAEKEDYADRLEFQLEDGQMEEVLMQKDFEHHFVDQVIELIDAEILELKRFLATCLDGDFVGYMDSIHGELGN